MMVANMSWIAICSFIIFVLAIISHASIPIVHVGSRSKWFFADSFHIPSTSLKLNSVESVSSERSFIECCMKCDASGSCLGVAFDGEECRTLNGTAGLMAAAVGGEQDSTVKVTVLNETIVQQVS